MNRALGELAASTLLIVGALFPIVNPLGNTPIFLTLTRGLSGPGRARLARTIAVNGLVLMVVSIFIGTHILGFFGISLPVVQVGGGLVVISTVGRYCARPITRKPPRMPKSPATRRTTCGRPSIR